MIYGQNAFAWPPVPNYSNFTKKTFIKFPDERYIGDFLVLSETAN